MILSGWVVNTWVILSSVLRWLVVERGIPEWCYQYTVEMIGIGSMSEMNEQSNNIMKSSPNGDWKNSVSPLYPYPLLWKMPPILWKAPPPLMGQIWTQLQVEDIFDFLGRTYGLSYSLFFQKINIFSDFPVFLRYWKIAT